MTPKQVREVLKKVMDPELGINIVDLGLVYKIDTSDQIPDTRVRITMTLTTPGCPLGGWFMEQVKQAVVTGLKINENQVKVEITFDPPWSQELMTEEAKMQLGM